MKVSCCCANKEQFGGLFFSKKKTVDAPTENYFFLLTAPLAKSAAFYSGNGRSWIPEVHL